MVPEGYITIDEAVATYGRPKAWWYRQITDGNITSYSIPGLKVTFLRKDEVEAFLQPKPRNKDIGSDTESRAG